MSQIEGVQGLSRWAIDKALRAPSTFGLEVERGATSMPQRPGWSLFGLQPPDLDLR